MLDITQFGGREHLMRRAEDEAVLEQLRNKHLEQFPFRARSPHVRVEDHAWAGYSMWAAIDDVRGDGTRRVLRRPTLEQLDGEPSLFGD